MLLTTVRSSTNSWTVSIRYTVQDCGSKGVQPLPCGPGQCVCLAAVEQDRKHQVAEYCWTSLVLHGYRQRHNSSNDALSPMVRLRRLFASDSHPPDETMSLPRKVNLSGNSMLSTEYKQDQRLSMWGLKLEGLKRNLQSRGCLC